MSSNNTEPKKFKKTIAKIFLIISIIIFVLVMAINIYFSGQMKIINKCSTAFERNDYKAYSACFVDGESISEEYFQHWQDSIREDFNLTKDENFHIKNELIRRTNVNKMVDNVENSYLVGVYETTYSKDIKEKFEIVYSLELINGKWKIYNIGEFYV